MTVSPLRSVRSAVGGRLVGGARQEGPLDRPHRDDRRRRPRSCGRSCARRRSAKRSAICSGASENLPSSSSTASASEYSWPEEAQVELGFLDDLAGDAGSRPARRAARRAREGLLGAAEARRRRAARRSSAPRSGPCPARAVPRRRSCRRSWGSTTVSICELPREQRAKQRPGAAVGDQRALARVLADLDADRADRARHAGATRSASRPGPPARRPRPSSSLSATSAARAPSTSSSRPLARVGRASIPSVTAASVTVGSVPPRP